MPLNSDLANAAERDSAAADAAPTDQTKASLAFTRWLQVALTSIIGTTGTTNVLAVAEMLARLAKVNIMAALGLTVKVTHPTAGAPTVALAGAGAGNVNDGDHKYLVTFITPGGETSAGTASAAVTVADKTVDGKVAVSGIPLGGAACTARKIYRNSVAVPGTFHLLTTISNNTATTYTDNSSDASIAAAAVAPTVNTAIDTMLTVDQDGTDIEGLLSVTGAISASGDIRSTTGNLATKLYLFVPNGGGMANEESGGGAVLITAAGAVTICKPDGSVYATFDPATSLLAMNSGFKVGANQVVGTQGAAVADSTDVSDAAIKLNTLLARLRAHGLIAT